MNKFILVLSLCLTPALFAEDTTKKTDETKKTETLDPILRLQEMYNKNKERAQQRKPSTDNADDAEVEQPPSKLKLFLKGFGREFVIGLGVGYGYSYSASWINGEVFRPNHRSILIWSAIYAAGINIPGILDFGLRHII